MNTLLHDKPVSPYLPSQQKPPTKPGSAIAVLQNIPVQTKINVGKVSSGKSMTVNNKANFPRAAVPSAALSTVLTPGKSLLKEKEKKSSMQYSSQPFVDDKMAGDDDINDVAAMGGVNLAEESQRILGSTELIGTQIRCVFHDIISRLAVTIRQIRSVLELRPFTIVFSRYKLEKKTASIPDV